MPDVNKKGVGSTEHFTPLIWTHTEAERCGHQGRSPGIATSIPTPRGVSRERLEGPHAHASAPPHTRGTAALRLTPSFRSRLRRVLGLRPRATAAPRDPSIFHPLECSTRRMCARSISTRIVVFG